MKTLSVLLTVALFVAANQLAAHLRRAHALPAQTARRTNDVSAIGSLSMARFHVSQQTQ